MWRQLIQLKFEAGLKFDILIADPNFVENLKFQVWILDGFWPSFVCYSHSFDFHGFLRFLWPFKRLVEHMLNLGFRKAFLLILKKLSHEKLLKTLNAMRQTKQSISFTNPTSHSFYDWCHWWTSLSKRLKRLQRAFLLYKENRFSYLASFL